MRRVVITGIGIVSSIGNNAAEGRTADAQFLLGPETQRLNTMIPRPLVFLWYARIRRLTKHRLAV